jgi:hypothetical protein
MTGARVIKGHPPFGFAAGLIATACVAVVVACSGGSSGSHVAQLRSTATQSSSSASSPAASAQKVGAVGFAHCMRSHGVTNWPDPNSSGVFDKAKVTSQQLNVSSTVLQAAQNTCQALLPAESVTQQRLNAAQALQFSQCMRSHAVSNFPDPDGTGRIPDPASLGIDQGATEFQAANVACAQYRPPYIPSNEAYDSYAATAGAS